MVAVVLEAGEPELFMVLLCPLMLADGICLIVKGVVKKLIPYIRSRSSG